MKLNRRNLLLASSAVITVTFSTPTAQAQRYWDNTGNTTGFGTAGGVWGNLGSGNTTGNSTQGWNANTTGAGATQVANFTTLTSTALFFGNGTLGLAGGTIGISGSVSAGNMTFATNTGAITLGNATGVGNITFGVTAATSTISVANTTGNVNIASNIIGGNLTKAGAGTLILSGNNTYTGTTIIAANGGTLQIDSANALSSASQITIVKTGLGTSKLVLNTSGTNVYNNTFGNFGSANGLVNGGTAHIQNAQGNNTLSGNMNLSAGGGNGINIQSDAGLLTIAGNLTQGSGASGVRPIYFGGAGNGIISGIVSPFDGNRTPTIVKLGAGTWSVTGTNNSFTGGVYVLDGVLNVASVADTGTNSSIGASGTINLTGQGTSGTLQYTGSTAVTTNRALDVAATGGTLDASGTGSGTLKFTGGFTASSPVTNTYTYVSGSNLATNTQQNLSPGTVAGGVMTMDSTALPGSTTITSISGNVLTLSANATSSGLVTTTFVDNVARTLTLTGSNTGANEISSNMGNSAGGGVLSISKTGNGTWVLSGNNTYSGNTTISAGTLAVNGSLTSSTVKLDSGTLDGTGTAGTVTVADLAANTITNGNGGSSALTLGSLTLAGDATFNIRTAGSAGVIVSGALTTTPASGTALVNVTSGPTWVTGNTYDLISFGTSSLLLTDFTKGTIAGIGGRQSSVLALDGDSLNLVISGESVRWTGNATTAWTTTAVGTPFNWITTGGNVTTEFLATDDVIFDNSATGAGNVIVDITDASVSPNSVIFNNTSARDYTINGNGSFGIASGSLSVTGGGNVTLNTVNTYTGLTTVSSGNLVLGSLASGNALTLGAAGTADFQNAGQTLGAVSNANTATNALNFSAGNGTVTLASLSGAGNTRFGSDGIVTGGISTGTVTSVGNLTASISGGTVTAGSLSSTSISGGNTTVGGIATIGTMTSGTANLNGATSAITILNGGAINLGTTALTVTNGSTSGTITGAGGSLIKAGSGTLTLSGNNSYGGGTFITGAGSIVAVTTDSNALGTGNVTLNGGRRLTIAGGLNIANDIIIATIGGESTRGMLETTGTATYSGNITINSIAGAGGHFYAAGGEMTLSGVITSSVQATQRSGNVTYSGGGTGYGNLSITGIGRVGALDGLSTSATVEIGTTGGAGTLDLNGFDQSLVGIIKGPGTATIGTSSTTANSTLTLTGTSSYAGTIVDVIPLSGGNKTVALTVASGGNLTLSAANTYTGATTISGGTLQIGAGSTTGAIDSTSGVINNGALVYSRSDAHAAAYAISGNGTVTKVGAGNLNLSGNNTYSGNTTIDGTGVAVAATILTVSNDNALGSTVGGTKFMSGVGTVNSGDGVRMVLANGVTVTGETLTIETANATRTMLQSPGNATWAGNVIIDTLGTGFSQISASNTGSSNLVIGANSTNTFTINGSTSFRGNGNITVNSTVSGAGALGRTDGGTLFLTAANDHTGNTTISNGIINLSNELAAQDSTLAITSTGGSATNGFRFNSAVVANAFSIGGLSATAAGTAKNIALQNDLSTAIALTVGSNNANTTYNGVLSAGGSLIKTGTGTLTLGGNSTYTGTTTVSDGILSLGSSLAIQNSALDTAGSITGNSTAGLRTTATTLTMGGLTGNKNLADVFETATGGYGNVTALTLNPGANVTHSYSGGIADGATGMTLTKSGLGTQILSGNNTYTGATNVDNGTLRINGSVSTSLVTVNSGGTLGGNGSIGGSVNVTSGGTFAAGSSIESIVVGGDFTTANGTFAYELDKSVLPGVAGDLTTVGGNLTLSLAVTNTLTLTELGIGGAWELGTPLGDPFGSPAADKLTLIAYFGTWNGGLFTYNGNLVQDDSAIIINSQQWWFNYNDTTAGTNYMGDLGLSTSFVTITVPEPNVAALLGGLGTLALLRRRRTN